MYNSYFGFTEAPFSIAPNPHYLFLSDRHREALAHLTYGMSDSGGFVLLTGEVGTGKTTVSRCLMEQLPENTQSAFILNPTLSERELLATICDEFRIRYRKSDATIKTLTDKISGRLLKNHEAGTNTLLIIDEAQHLRPEVLEQLRLLTNLETHTKKLLKVILIGQPELQQLLRRQDLRQLAQRITARYHLLPLNREEVSQYIVHRMQVAGCQQPVFAPSAIVAIHKLSGGIPRLINLLCDRSLLGAYGKSQPRVSRATVMAAADEALGREYRPSWWDQNKKMVAIAAGVGLMAVVGSATFQLAQSSDPAPKVETVVEETVPSLPELLVQAANTRVPEQAFIDVLTTWKVNIDVSEDPCLGLSPQGLACFWKTMSLDELAALNRPAVLQLTDNTNAAFYAAIVSVSDESVNLAVGQQQYTLNYGQLRSIWNGGSVIIWQPSMLPVEVINEHSKIDRIQWLENSISYYFKRQPRVVESLDVVLLNDLALFQRQNGLAVSPEVDVETQIHLNNAMALPVPKLSKKV